jgi:hypothetical protein
MENSDAERDRLVLALSEAREKLLEISWRTDLTAEEIARANPDHRVVKAWRKAAEMLAAFDAEHRHA